MTKKTTPLTELQLKLDEFKYDKNAAREYTESILTEEDRVNNSKYVDHLKEIYSNTTRKNIEEQLIAWTKYNESLAKDDFLKLICSSNREMVVEMSANLADLHGKTIEELPLV